MKYLIDKSQKYIGGLQDTITNGTTDVLGLTLEEYIERHNVNPDDLQVLTEDEFDKHIEQYRQSKIEPFEEISQERYDHMLGILPPVNFTGNYFQISEALTMDLRATFYFDGNKHYEATLPTGTIKDNREYIEEI